MCGSKGTPTAQAVNSTIVSIRVADISRPDSESLETTAASITDVKHLSAYNWIEASAPTIAIPGSPPLWSPPKAPQKVAKDSGLIYIAQNAARHPESPLEPLFRALYIADPSFDVHSVDLVTDRNNIRKLLSFVNPNLAKNGLEPFTINIEVTKNTAIFCRSETETLRFIGPGEFMGFGHEFEKSYTTSQVGSSTGHHRIISYRFSDLKFIVRYETDGYVDIPSKVPARNTEIENDKLSSMIQSLSLSPPKSLFYPASAESTLVIKEDGKEVPIESTLEIKTRVFHKPIAIQEVLPQVWVSQTPNLVRAYHRNGLFERPEVEDVTLEIKRWEEDHQEDLRRLAALIKKIIKVVRKNGGNAIFKYDHQSDKLAVWKADGRKMLPDDLYSKLNGENSGKTESNESSNLAVGSNPPKTTLKIGNVFYDIDLLMIPYLSSFVRSQRRAQPQASEFVHSDIPLFDIALKGLESGYRHCFRLLPADISRYHTICETYDFLRVDVVGGQSVDNIFVDLRACKTSYELDYKRYRPVKGNKSTARDAAFRLLFLILNAEFREEIKDTSKVYNAVLFVVSHPGTFKWRTRTVVRAAYEERFAISPKQRAQLNHWSGGEPGKHASDDDKTTEEELSEPYYYSDDS